MTKLCVQWYMQLCMQWLADEGSGMEAEGYRDWKPQKNLQDHYTSPAVQEGHTVSVHSTVGLRIIAGISWRLVRVQTGMLLAMLRHTHLAASVVTSALCMRDEYAAEPKLSGSVGVSWECEEHASAAAQIEASRYASN
jgi:hypothetical protein